MPAPMWLARFNKRATNRVLGPIVTRLPGFGMIVHRGRKSGREYRTPLAAFRQPNGYVIALIYGPNTDWVRNVLASGRCSFETRGRSHNLTAPRMFHDPTRRAVPRWIRPPLRLLRVSDFLELKVAAVPDEQLPETSPRDS